MRTRVLTMAMVPALMVAASGVAAAQDDSSIRFTWWGNPERDAATGQMVEMFMEANPDITVQAEPTVFDGYFDKLATSTAAGDAQDVITLGGSYPTEYGAAGQLLDLTTVADIVHLDAYDPNTYSAATVGDAVYGLPTGGNALGMFVNVDMLAEAGIELPDDSTWTWDDFVAFAGEVSAATAEDVYGTDWRLAEVKQPFATQMGHPFYLPEGGVGLDEATAQALFELPLALLENGGMPPAEITIEMNDTAMEQTLFGQGKAATMPGYSNQLQAFHDLLGADVDIVKLPGESGMEQGLSVLPSQFFAVYAGSDNPEAAAKLVDWLLNEPEAAKVILGNRGLSFNPAILEAISPELAEYDAKSAAYLSRIAQEGGPYLPPPAAGQGEVDDLSLRLQEEVLFGLSTPAEAAAILVEEATAIVP